MNLSSHYYLYNAFNNSNCVKAALHQLDISWVALQYLYSVILLWPDKISRLNLVRVSTIWPKELEFKHRFRFDETQESVVIWKM